VNGRAARVLAWSIGTTTILVAVTRVVLAIVDPASSDGSNGPTVPGGGWPVAVFEAIVLVAVAVIGAVVAARQPRNAVGWILCVIPFSLGVLILCAHAFWSFALHGHESSAGAQVTAWLATWMWVLALMPTVTLFPLLFPTGRLLTPRWRPMIWLSVATIIMLTVSESLRPGQLPEYPIDNPFGVEDIETVLEPVGSVLMVVTALTSIASLVIRFRRSRGDERQQIKWVAMSAVGFVALFATASIIQTVLGLEDVGFAIMLAGFLVVASGVAVAMLRYRLYDIDVVINRALVYASLTALLAGTYLGGVLLLQLLLSRFTEGSGLAVAASTLGTAALVRPARARIQTVVDRRFFRQKYDAARTLDQFGARVRREVDLDDISAELVAVAAETMRPAHIALWTPGGLR
jgi:hypothetical protein